MLKKKLRYISLYYFVFITCCVVLTSILFRVIKQVEPLFTTESIQSALLVGGIHGVAFFFLLPLTKRHFLAAIEHLDKDSIENNSIKMVLRQEDLQHDNLEVVVECLKRNECKEVAFDEQAKIRSFVYKSSVKSLGYGIVLKSNSSDGTMHVYCLASKYFDKKKRGKVLSRLSLLLAVTK